MSVSIEYKNANFIVILSFKYEQHELTCVHAFFFTNCPSNSWAIVIQINVTLVKRSLNRLLSQLWCSRSVKAKVTRAYLANWLNHFWWHKLNKLLLVDAKKFTTSSFLLLLLLFSSFFFFLQHGFDDQIRAKTKMTRIIIINIYILKYNIREMLFSEWHRRHEGKNPNT